MKKATMRDVAAMAGVSVSSVSRYVNDPMSINPIPALRIEKAIKELGFIPNTYAQGLKRGDSRTVAVVVPGLGPFFSNVCQALSDFFFQHKYLLYICETGEDPEKERYYVNSLIGQQVAGLLIALSGRTSDFLVETQKKFPNIVLIDQYEENCPIDTVYEESLNSSYELTKSMLARGHRQFMLLFRTKASTNTPHRLEGTARALREAGLNIDDMYTHFDIHTEEDIYNRIQQNMVRTPRPTAIIGYSPLIMENTMIALNRLNKKIPGEIDLAGYTLNDFHAKFRFELPCVVQQPYELGIHAGDVLLRRLRRQSEQPIRQHCLPAEVTLPEKEFHVVP